MTSPSSGSPKWKLPEDVMKLHKFKLKKRALQERMNKPIPSTGAKSQGASNSKIKDTLYEDWGKSFLSLFQLVRVCQCPYFYVSANTFTCLFRAAGICGHSDIHALLTPTTRGFRHLLKVDDVVFTMPLNSKTFHSSENTKSIGSESLSNDNINESIETIEEIGADEEVEDDLWLESMGVSTEEIWRLNSTQAKLVHQREKKVDQTRESLIYVEGVEVQALFNFLMNCKSSVATSGFLAGIPPTLLAPVAFHGATLKPLKVRQSTVIYFSSHPPVYEKDTKICVWNCALHSASDVVFDCCAHVHIGWEWGGRRDCYSAGSDQDFLRLLTSDRNNEPGSFVTASLFYDLAYANNTSSRLISKLNPLRATAWTGQRASYKAQLCCFMQSVLEFHEMHYMHLKCRSQSRRRFDLQLPTFRSFVHHYSLNTFSVWWTPKPILEVIITTDNNSAAPELKSLTIVQLDKKKWINIGSTRVSFISMDKQESTVLRKNHEALLYATYKLVSREEASKEGLSRRYTPSDSLMWPLLPCLVLSSTGLNQVTSSGLKNINLTTAERLWILNGCPLKTTRFATIRFGFTDKTLPVATNS
uniref:Uncharacterized protein n=1 Tax=Timema cristinae TaxID=61476 RepID=A0A7R9GS38_TIMCR|nr:unnamed protein product [Timema cristinae]